MRSTFQCSDNELLLSVTYYSTFQQRTGWKCVLLPTYMCYYATDYIDSFTSEILQRDRKRR